VSIAAVYPQALIDKATNDVREKVAIVIGFVLLAILILAELLVRSITGVLGMFSRRAKEIGEGRFKGDLPVQGNDEFAQFARTFNTMAAELEQRIEELDGERRRVQEAVGRFGQALESTHDVSALLGIVIESAMEAVGARGGRVVIVDEQTNSLVEHRRLGTADDLPDDVLPARIVIGEGVEGLAAQTGHPALQNEPVPVLAVPLQTTQAVVGLLTVTDPARGTFGEEDGGTLQALASQGAIAIENARMHRLITKQASTDGLTGLNNHRDFHEQLRREIERTERFTLPLALIIMDLDDFKLINDRFGHLTGDAVLRDVAATLREGIREIDTAARYGGEEFAIILPERPSTTNNDDHRVSVTASFGIAAMPGDGTTQVELVAAADEALYRAKRAGKNRIAIAAATEPQA
jgi:GGDEF domain-containing protein/HAMP domain-containing protein